MCINLPSWWLVDYKHVTELQEDAWYGVILFSSNEQRQHWHEQLASEVKPPLQLHGWALHAISGSTLLTHIVSASSRTMIAPILLEVGV